MISGFAQYFPAFEVEIYVLIFLSMMVAGTVKGTIGVGFPVVSVALLSSFLPAHLVLGIVVVPTLLTNTWQAFAAGNPMPTVRRFWPLILFQLIFIWVGAQLAVLVDQRILFGVIGGAVLIYVGTSLLKLSWELTTSRERWSGAIAGSIGGLMGGLCAIWGPPIMIYIQMLHLAKEDYMKTVGLIWFSAGLPLVIAYGFNGILNAAIAPLSLLACIPAFLGFTVGAYIRRRVDQNTFGRIVLIFLLVTGVNLIRRAIYG